MNTPKRSENEKLNKRTETNCVTDVNGNYTKDTEYQDSNTQSKNTKKGKSKKSFPTKSGKYYYNAVTGYFTADEDADEENDGNSNDLSNPEGNPEENIPELYIQPILQTQPMQYPYLQPQSCRCQCQHRCCCCRSCSCNCNCNKNTNNDATAIVNFLVPLLIGNLLQNQPPPPPESEECSCEDLNDNYGYQQPCPPFPFPPPMPPPPPPPEKHRHRRKKSKCKKRKQHKATNGCDRYRPDRGYDSYRPERIPMAPMPTCQGQDRDRIETTIIDIERSNDQGLCPPQEYSFSQQSQILPNVTSGYEVMAKNGYPNYDYQTTITNSTLPLNNIPTCDEFSSQQIPPQQLEQCSEYSFSTNVDLPSTRNLMNIAVQPSRDFITQSVLPQLKTNENSKQIEFRRSKREPDQEINLPTDPDIPTNSPPTSKKFMVIESVVTVKVTSDSGSDNDNDDDAAGNNRHRKWVKNHENVDGEIMIFDGTPSSPKLALQPKIKKKSPPQSKSKSSSGHSGSLSSSTKTSTTGSGSASSGSFN